MILRFKNTGKLSDIIQYIVLVKVTFFDFSIEFLKFKTRENAMTNLLR